jgi:hypothetical protein
MIAWQQHTILPAIHLEAQPVEAADGGRSLFGADGRRHAVLIR